MKEVKRVLTAHGILLARVNSINDIKLNLIYGAYYSLKYGVKGKNAMEIALFLPVSAHL